MSLRLRSQWTQSERTRSPEDLASVAAANAWKAACNGVLNLENEGFETQSRAQRLDIIEEFVAFLLLVADRYVYARVEPEVREQFVTAMALRLADLVEENRLDAQGEGPHRSVFIDKLNERTGTYAECPFSEEEGPGFSMYCGLGDRITEVIGPTQRKWTQDQVVAIDGPDAVKAFMRALKGLFDPNAEPRRRRRGGATSSGD